MAYIFQPQSICLIEINNYIEKSRISESAENEKMSPKKCIYKIWIFSLCIFSPSLCLCFLRWCYY